MSPERATEIIRLGNQYANYSTFCTSQEYEEVVDLWDTMPGHTCWYDALVRIARGKPVKQVCEHGHKVSEYGHGFYCHDCKAVFYPDEVTNIYMDGKP